MIIKVSTCSVHMQNYICTLNRHEQWLKFCKWMIRMSRQTFVIMHLLWLHLCSIFYLYTYILEITQVYESYSSKHCNQSFSLFPRHTRKKGMTSKTTTFFLERTKINAKLLIYNKPELNSPGRTKPKPNLANRGEIKARMNRGALSLSMYRTLGHVCLSPTLILSVKRQVIGHVEGSWGAQGYHQLNEIAN